MALSSRYIPDRFLPDKVGGWVGACTRAGRGWAEGGGRPPHAPPLTNSVSLPHPTARDSPVPPPAQAIDLLDEAGSRVRIATYHARRAAAAEAGDAAAREGLEAAANSYLELEQVIAGKDEAVQVGERRLGVGGRGRPLVEMCRAREGWQWEVLRV